MKKTSKRQDPTDADDSQSCSLKCLSLPSKFAPSSWLLQGRAPDDPPICEFVHINMSPPSNIPSQEATPATSQIQSVLQLGQPHLDWWQLRHKNIGKYVSSELHAHNDKSGTEYISTWIQKGSELQGADPEGYACVERSKTQGIKQRAGRLGHATAHGPEPPHTNPTRQPGRENRTQSRSCLIPPRGAWPADHATQAHPAKREALLIQLQTPPN
eukprot:354857-Chlamydomonas_euryale.AAC.30